MKHFQKAHYFQPMHSGFGNKYLPFYQHIFQKKTFWGGWKDDNLFGTHGRDRMFGGRGDDIIEGHGGNDRIYGGKGDDAVFGGDGNDHVFGGRDDDTVGGGAGSDAVYGGRGDDLAVFTIAENVGSFDRYDGGRGVDTLRLEFTGQEWLDLNASGGLQEDLTDFAAFMDHNTHARHGQANGRSFIFDTIGLKAKRFETLEVTIDGQVVDAADDLVITGDDFFTGADGSFENGSAIHGSVLANDAVADQLREVRLIADVGASQGALSLAADGTFTFNPGSDFQALAEGETAEVSFDYEVEDADGDTDQATVKITVTGTNDAPVAAIDLATAEARTIGLDGSPVAPVTGSVAINDSDVDAGAVLQFSLNEDVAGLALDSDGNYSFDPSDPAYASIPKDVTVDVIANYTVTDENGASDTSTLTISVSGTNVTPIAVIDYLNVTAQTSATPIPPILGSVATNDIDPDFGDVLTFVLDEAVAGLTFNSDGSYLFDPADPAYASLAEGEELTLSVGYTVTDFAGESDRSELVITIVGTNDGPIALRDGVSEVAQPIFSDLASAVFIDGNVSANDSDPDNGAVLTYTLDAPVTGLTMASDGTFIYFKNDPSIAALAVDDAEFIYAAYTVTDELGGTAKSDLKITIVGANDAPVATYLTRNVDAVTGDPNALYEPIQIGTVAYDGMDVDDLAVLTFALDEPVPGLTMNARTGELHFDERDPAYIGLADGETLQNLVAYTVTDEYGATGASFIDLKVTGANDGPVAVADEINITARSSASGAPAVALVQGSVATNDSDPDGNDVLTYELNTAVAGLRMNVDGSFTFDPSNAAYQGLNEGVSTEMVADYTVYDGRGGIAQSNLTILVTGTNDAPTARNVSDIAVRTPEPSDPNQFVVHSRTVAPSATDPDDGAVLTFALSTPVDGLRMSSNGTYYFDANNPAYANLAVGEEVTVSASYTATDQFGGQDAAELNIRANVTNTAPQIPNNYEDRIFDYAEGLPFEGQLVAWDAETPTSKLRFEFDSIETNEISPLFFELREDGSFTYIPAPSTPDNPYIPTVGDNETADDFIFNYRVFDEQGLQLDIQGFGSRDEGIGDASLNPITRPDGVKDTVISVTQGDSADQLKVTLTGVLVDGDGSESTSIDTAATAGNLTIVSSEQRVENNQLIFEYVFDWGIDDTVDLAQPLTIDIRTTEAVRTGEDPNLFDPERQGTTTLSYDLDLALEKQVTRIDQEFVSLDQNVWSAGAPQDHEISGFFGLDTGEFDKSKGFLGGDFKVDLEGQFKFGFTPTLTLQNGTVDASVYKTIETTVTYNETFDQFKFAAFSRTNAAQIETSDMSGSLSLDIEALAKLKVDVEADLRVNLFGEKIGLYEKGTIINESFDVSGNIFELNTDDLGSLNPGVLDPFESDGQTIFVPGVDPRSTTIKAFWPDETGIENSVNFDGGGGTRTVSADQENKILSIDTDLDKFVFNWAKANLSADLVPGANPLEPVSLDAGGLTAKLAVADIDLKNLLSFNQDFDLSHKGLKGVVVFEDGTEYDVDVFEFGDANSGAALEINDASKHANEDGDIKFEFFVTPDASLRNQTDIDFETELEARLILGELDVPVLPTFKFGPLLTLSTDTSANLYGFDNTFDLAFNETSHSFLI